MEVFGNSKNNMSSPMENKHVSLPLENSGVNLVELNDFYSLLDEKTVQKIKETTTESIARISKDVEEMEYETNGAKAILDMLK